MSVNGSLWKEATPSIGPALTDWNFKDYRGWNVASLESNYNLSWTTFSLLPTPIFDLTSM